MYPLVYALNTELGQEEDRGRQAGDKQFKSTKK